MRALGEFRIEGVATNRSFLTRLLGRTELVAGELTTRFVDEHLRELVPSSEEAADEAPSASPASGQAAVSGRAGADVDSTDPLALFAHNEATREAASAAATTAGSPATVAPVADGPAGTVGFPTPIQGTIVSVSVAEGDVVQPGSKLVVLEAMKMEHAITADRTGIVRAVRVVEGDIILEGFPIVFIEEADVEVGALEDEARPDPDHIRDDLAELYHRRSYTLDENRPEAVERRRGKNQLTARENLAALVDPGSFKRVRAAGHRGPAGPPERGMAPGENPGRRSHRRPGHRQRRPVRPRGGPLHGHHLRLHGPGRHPGWAQPLQEGPHVRRGHPLPAPGGVLHRRWGRSARRHRLDGLDRDGGPDLHHVVPAQRPRPPGRAQLGLLLRRQHRPPGLLRRDHRHQGPRPSGWGARP